MPHSLPLITTLAAALALALMLGFIAVKLRLPALVGYLIAGIMLGPFTPGFVADPDIAAEFAEIGVMLLMFGVGLHFSLDNLLKTRKIALPGALLQIVVATSLGAGLAIFWGWHFKHALVFGLALSVASTVVLSRALESRGLLGSINGQIAVGWLIVEDIFMILALILLPFLAHWFETAAAEAPHLSLGSTLGVAFLKISAFIAIMLLVGRWMLPKLLWHIARTGSRELFTLCVIAVAVSIAFGASKLFGITLSLGAFFAGMIIKESKFSARAAEELLPFRDAFAVLFFVSVGMLFNPAIFIEHPVWVLSVVGIIVIGKSIAAGLLVLAFRYPLNTALTVSASLAQIGEFSFILANQAVELKLLPVQGQSLILAGALISISINPLIFKLIEPFQQWLRARYLYSQAFERPEDPLVKLPMTTTEKYLSDHVVLIGYGDVGKHIAGLLHEHSIPCVIVDQNRDIIEQLRNHQDAAIFGNACESSTLVQAHTASARMLVVTTVQTSDIQQTINIARKLNPKIDLVICVQSKEEKILLGQEIVGAIFLSEEELAKSMAKHILARFQNIFLCH